MARNMGRPKFVPYVPPQIPRRVHSELVAPAVLPWNSAPYLMLDGFARPVQEHQAQHNFAMDQQSTYPVHNPAQVSAQPCASCMQLGLVCSRAWPVCQYCIRSDRPCVYYAEIWATANILDTQQASHTQQEPVNDRKRKQTEYVFIEEFEPRPRKQAKRNRTTNVPSTQSKRKQANVHETGTLDTSNASDMFDNVESRSGIQPKPAREDLITFDHAASVDHSHSPAAPLPHHPMETFCQPQPSLPASGIVAPSPTQAHEPKAYEKLMKMLDRDSPLDSNDSSQNAHSVVDPPRNALVSEQITDHSLGSSHTSTPNVPVEDGDTSSTLQHEQSAESQLAGHSPGYTVLASTAMSATQPDASNKCNDAHIAQGLSVSSLQIALESMDTTLSEMLVSSPSQIQPHSPRPVSQMSPGVTAAPSALHLTSTTTSRCASPPQKCPPSPAARSSHPPSTPGRIICASVNMSGVVSGNVNGLVSESLMEDALETSVRDRLTIRIPPNIPTEQAVPQADIAMDKEPQADTRMDGNMMHIDALNVSSPHGLQSSNPPSPASILTPLTQLSPLSSLTSLSPSPPPLMLPEAAHKLIPVAPREYPKAVVEYGSQAKTRQEYRRILSCTMRHLKPRA